MNCVIDEKGHSEKELFELKRFPDTLAKIDEFLKINEPEFYKARQQQDFEEMFKWLCKNMKIDVERQRFVYFLDFNFWLTSSISNLTPNYRLFLQNGLTELKYAKETNGFCGRYNSILDNLLLLVERIVGELKAHRPDNYEAKLLWFCSMKESPAKTFEEALQRILFLNQMLWQCGSKLVGLGRLDMLLYPYYVRDVKNGILTEEQAVVILKDFMGRLHEHYWLKSNALMGDTGQVIILGGSDEEGNYVRNELTGLILKVIMELQLSDPKIVLRVCKNIPKDLMEMAIRCMMTGVGSPLLANDDVIIHKLLAFGIEKEDACEYTTSACWEPLIGGKSSSMNNEGSLSYVKALNNLLLEEKLARFDNFENLKQCYFEYLLREIRIAERAIFSRQYLRNTLFSVFIEGCRENRKDILEGGAKYHNVGMTTVGLGNVVNALLNIKKYVFEEKKFTLVDVKKISVFDYQGYEGTEEILKNNEEQYGFDQDQVIELSNEILRFVSEYTKDFRTPIGGRLKFGVSSPSYITLGSTTPASFDGRRSGDPFIVHISNEKATAYTELIHFAASLDYNENRFNGNVVDFMVNPAFIEQNFEKFVLMILRGIEVGFFQLQMNVLNSETLIDAKKKPEKFPNLIVRVWGFSAYFVELPESYQDVLIERALQNEGKI